MQMNAQKNNLRPSMLKYWFDFKGINYNKLTFDF